MNYSGKTSCYEHKHGDAWKSSPGHGKDCIQTHVVFEAQWTNCPIEVYEEVRKLWADRELGNDYFYVNWNSEEDGEEYPLIDEYLKSRNVTECLIHWWW